MTFARSSGPFAAGACDILSRTDAETGTLLRALARLTDLDWTATVAGPDADAVLVAPLADRVRVVADIDESSWNRAGCYCHAGGLDAALFEALRRGLPVALVSDSAALVPPEACVLVSPGAVDDLSKALRRVVFDDALRARMADAAIAFAATLPPDDAPKG